MSVGLLSHESTERNDGRDTCEEQEDRRRQTLHVDTVLQHTPVHSRVVAVLHVVDHTSEKSTLHRHKEISNNLNEPSVTRIIFGLKTAN